MKKKLTIGLFLILLAFTCQAQRIYSKENLTKASSEDLNLYYEKAKKIKKTGGVLTVAGPLSAITAALLIGPIYSGGSGFLWMMDVGLFFAGIGATVIGIPTLITGHSRVKNIEAIKYAMNDGFKIDIVPSGIYNYASQNYQPGITLRIRF